ncbi:L-ribulose-5-phosphate 4-epimerase [Helicobacter sp. 13S00401-1]|uniref:L-ribulose-5-phosphate 4-epimerase AraD n=1 Tax=Helicobacter sp. 13S00401-1 TaxID=1905758 RepID=UPI000BA65E4E|nr:L-ribulose-5-phosphate 4-epimerase AraD [Helicobacter sp. 13S00401-1]PAF49653.1 L-ribulose-5-phosphate 4-epimerase [Helicobacter sp. 13S00401-1]
MFEELKLKAFEANKRLANSGLIMLTWGNVSNISKDRKYICIKPSGVDYSALKPSDMVVVDLEANVIEGLLKPSSDLQTHLWLYKSFPLVYGICHTHSNYATSFAQAGLTLKPLGTTHSDYFNGEIPCTRKMRRAEIESEYELNTGKLIVESFQQKRYEEIPAILVYSHGVFTWGKDASNAVENAMIVEEIAKMNYQTRCLNLKVKDISKSLLNKHFYRKHGKDKYYGQD